MRVINKHGLLEGHTPDNLLAYGHGDAQYCRDFTKEEYHLLYTMLGARAINFQGSLYYDPSIAEALDKCTPNVIKDALRLMPERASIGYVSIKKQQAMIQQVADEDLPLFVDIKGNDKEDTKVLKTILEWRFKCQAK